MVHEMIHMFNSYNRINDEPHGKEFLKISKKIKEQHGLDIHINFKDAFTNLKTNKNAHYSLLCKINDHVDVFERKIKDYFRILH